MSPPLFDLAIEGLEGVSIEQFEGAWGAAGSRIREISFQPLMVGAIFVQNSPIWRFLLNELEQMDPEQTVAKSFRLIDVLIPGEEEIVESMDRLDVMPILFGLLLDRIPAQPEPPLRLRILNLWTTLRPFLDADDVPLLERMLTKFPWVASHLIRFVCSAPLTEQTIKVLDWTPDLLVRSGSTLGARPDCSLLVGPPS